MEEPFRTEVRLYSQKDVTTKLRTRQGDFKGNESNGTIISLPRCLTESDPANVLFEFVPKSHNERFIGRLSTWCPSAVRFKTIHIPSDLFVLGGLNEECLRARRQWGTTAMC